MTLNSRIRFKLLKLYVKIVGEDATPAYIARGWAIGMFYGCLIPFGLQLACSIPTAFILKGSKIGATLGTLLTNHFTIFIIYPAQCFVGAQILRLDLTYEMVEKTLDGLVKEQSLDSLLRLGQDVIMAFFMGGAILTAIMTPLTYFLVKFIVVQHRKRKQRKAAVWKAILKN